MDAETLRDRLQQRAFLHDDPNAYLAGVADALASLDGQIVLLDDEHEAKGA